MIQRTLPCILILHLLYHQPTRLSRRTYLDHQLESPTSRITTTGSFLPKAKVRRQYAT
ncbi:hypothetical protein HanXRQr2_Chr15g0721751 [Helianthus annuus]|uniref:Uncharacterized protein n=1 Tax=Helianthus annuus TaxID=4232 RepID=A0A9K3E4U9_HELAN|nr:hypothetical protein HanXRQr2_Chr15g0721751 [Helianthus annuus]